MAFKAIADYFIVKLIIQNGGESQNTFFVPKGQ